ncbi:outer membrane protein assembly factor BamB family protein [Bythopirellula polymerisocia]|uniref:outer membrane protein assembly factor BamB family protein n=1 Tax=Bythopirellula polymerisocia TaxID=2528003 RepID=UPI0018D4D55B|nr:PQQ-binding-like beta-propeller repeat protein [Bythopirellula polymerisocia]
MSSDSQSIKAMPAAKSAWLPWFPLFWVVLIVGGYLYMQLGSLDQDVKNSSTVFCLGLLLFGLTGWVFLCSHYSTAKRLLWGGGPWILVLAGVASVELVNNGDVGVIDWRWRWSAKHDEKLSVPLGKEQIAIEWETTTHDYPRFLGNGFWAEVLDVQLATDWDEQPPVERWRCPVGAGWSGFAIVGDFAVTQEQRGSQELVVCYRVSSENPEGEIVWTHADPVRFDPSGAGALGYVGPRATPAIHDGRVLTVGATGILNCIDARSGSLLWTHDTLTENNMQNTMWGKACSPAILETEGKPTLVLMSVGAPSASLVAYDLETGKEVWAAGSRRSSYASPVICELLGERQILCVNEDFVTAHSATDGKILWEYPWQGNSDSDATASQPVPLSEDRVFLSKGYGVGASLVQLSRDESGDILAGPLWEPPIRKVMKTKMGNVIVRDGFIYGLDGGILQCIDVERGKSQWKKRRLPAIGHGQIMAIGDNLVILSETGELILVAIDPEEYQELASMSVFPSEEITWNNPAFSSPYLLLRNAEQAVCLKLPLADSADVSLAHTAD